MRVMACDLERPELVLASGSPRRRELLAQVGLEVTVAPTEADESVLPDEGAEALVERLARLKAGVGATASPAALVIAADTEVAVAGASLGKPTDTAHARTMLETLSGRCHAVHTGVAIGFEGRIVSAVATTTVTFDVLTDEVIDWYLASGEPMGKAGAYAIQGKAAIFITGIEGTHDNVVGLPIALVDRLLREVGWSIPRLSAGPRR